MNEKDSKANKMNKRIMAAKRTGMYQRALTTEEEDEIGARGEPEDQKLRASKRRTTVAFRLTRGQRNQHT